MTILDSGTINLAISVPQVLFDADTDDIPGIIGGHIDANALVDPDDIIKVQLQVKYSSGGSFIDAGTITFKQSDEICWFTPIEASFDYQIILTLLAGSPTSTANLDFVIQGTKVTT